MIEKKNKLKIENTFQKVERESIAFKKEFLSGFSSNNALSDNGISAFRTLIYRFYHQNGRNFPWRKTDNPYHIFVSEIMLQQTTVERVLTKYPAFIKTFPDFASVSASPFKEIMRLWSGLGYNRRALALKKSAHMVMEKFGGNLPEEPEKLITLPGVGKATASAVCAFAFNYPSVFVETNIRAVYIHFFFNDEEHIKDSRLLHLVALTVDRSDPRSWYYALMDYGVILKKMYKNPSQKSDHYQRQSNFEGSNRQKRSMIMKALLAHPSLCVSEIAHMMNQPHDEVRRNLIQLEREGMIVRKNTKYTIE